MLPVKPISEKTPITIGLLIALFGGTGLGGWLMNEVKVGGPSPAGALASMRVEMDQKFDSLRRELTDELKEQRQEIKELLRGQARMEGHLGIKRPRRGQEE
jgi:hypothetical protein